MIVRNHYYRLDEGGNAVCKTPDAPPVDIEYVAEESGVYTCPACLDQVVKWLRIRADEIYHIQAGKKE